MHIQNMNNNFFALVIVCLCSHTFEVDLPNDILTPEDYKCMAELGFEKKDVEAIVDKNFLIILNDPVTENYVECWFRKSNMVNDKNEFNFDLFREYVMRDILRLLGKEHVKNAESLVREAVDSCRNVEGTNIGDRALKIYNCVATAIHNF